nr:reverse transcriptase domain-containing protein [Tanacetum cinerariifolium]
MAASAIIVSFDSSDESVGSPPSRVILFGDIPTVIPFTSVIAPETFATAPVISSVTPMVETTLVASPTRLRGLVPYSDSDSDSPDEMDSPEYITPLLATSPFLYTDSSKASYSFNGPPSQDPYAITVARWRSRVTTRRPYRTHPNGTRRVMTVRNSPTDSLPVHSSGLDAPNQAHSGSSTRVVSPRLGYPPVRAPRHSEVFRRWCAAPLSIFCPLTTSESSSGDSSKRPLHLSSHSAGPSRKRCRSPADSVPSSTPVTGSLAPTRADLLPPRKRFRDSYSSETSIEEDTEIDTTETEDGKELDIVDRDDARDHVEIDPRDVRDDTEEYEADTSAGDTVEVGIDPMSAPVADEESEEPAGEDSSNSSGTRDGIVRSFKDMPIDLDDVVRDFYHHMSEVHIDRILGIETVQRRLEADQLIANGKRARMTKRIKSLMSENLMVCTLLCIERDRMDSLRLYMSRSQEEFLQIRDDRDDLRKRLKRTMTNTRSGMTPATIEEMINRQMATGMEMVMDMVEIGMEMEEAIEGVVCLIRWCEKMETMFHISNCPGRYQVKYATCTLLDSALTWWNSHKRTIGTDAAYTLSWKELMKLMTKVYCPRNEIQKMETELWNLSEEDWVDKFIGGLPDNIQGNGYVVKNAKNKRRFDTNHKDNHEQQPPFKRQNTGGQNVARAYTAGNNEKRDYRDTRPPMLDRTDFASWQQRIRLYCRGKDNGVNILKSIDEGPYKLGTFRETLAESTEGTPQFRFSKLINDMRNIKMTMPKLQPNSKIVNNMLLEWGRFVTAIKLNRGLRESNYD